MLRHRERRLIGRRALLAAAGSTLAAPAVVRAQANAGVALVIGNSRYQMESSLPNAKRDAADVAQRFQAYGLQTELVHDADRGAMQQAIDRLAAKAKGANFAAFYYAGHGVYWGNGSWIVPVDGDLSDPGNVANLITVDAARQAVKRANHGMIVFDNCLNNPADGWRQRATEDRAHGSPGVGFHEAPNTLALFSTVPGRIALDGPPGQNSPFGTVFLRQFDGSPVDLQSMPVKLRRDLLIETEARQIASYRDTYKQSFVLAAAGGTGGRGPVSRSAWAKDPAQIIELTNAYAYAGKNNLPLPLGLIAHRPTAGTPHANKVGAYKYDSEKTAALLIIMSVEEAKAAEVVMIYRHLGKPWFTFVHGSLSNDTLEVEPRNGGGHHVFTWSDANSGNVSIFPPKDEMKTVIAQSRFSRLDG